MSTETEVNAQGKTRSQISFGITGKLFLLIFLSFSVLVAALGYVVRNVADEVADSTIQRSLERSKLSLQTALQVRYATLLRTAKDLARDPALFPQIEAGESASVQDLSEELQRSLNFDLMIVTDRDGIILARSDQSSARGENAAVQSQLIALALSGKEASGIMRRKEELLQIVAVPVQLPAEKEIVLGTIAIASRLTPALAREIRDLTDADIAILSFVPVEQDPSQRQPRLQYSTLTEPKVLADFLRKNAALTQLVTQHELPTSALNMTLGGELYHAVVVPLARNDGSIEGTIVALRSRAELLLPFRRIGSAILWAALIVVATALSFALILSKSITRPILQLAKSAVAIRDGLPAQIPKTQSRDEIGTLSRAMEDMSRALREKAELENYLAAFGRSFEEEVLDEPELVASKTEIVQSAPVQSVPEERTQQMPAVVKGGVSLIRTPASPLLQLAKTQLSSNETDQGIIGPGQRFGERYFIHRELGRGAFGRVYLAEDLVLDETIALKVLGEQALTITELDSLKKELKLARRITHRNVVRTFDFGVIDGTSFISMEYVAGYSLAQLLRKHGRLPLRMAALLARQICSALAAAHREGILHRDLKPQNMIINRQGALKIMDFGLAVRVQRSAQAFQRLVVGSMESQSVDLPEICGIAGTPPYMSPEQFDGASLDIRTDIYAVGVILYEMLTGEVPFVDRDMSALVKRVHDEAPVPPSQTRSEVPPALDAIVLRALAKQRELRFANADELAQQLSELSTSSGQNDVIITNSA